MVVAVRDGFERGKKISPLAELAHEACRGIPLVQL